MLLPSLIGQQFSTIVSSAFIERRNYRMQLFNPNGRSDELRAVHADCEFLEDYLINQPGSDWDPPMQNCMAYDAIHREIGRVEFKCATGKTITIKPYCQKQIQSGMIEAFLIWKWAVKPNAILQEGDKVVCEILKIVPAKYVANNAIASLYNRNDLMMFCQ